MTRASSLQAPSSEYAAMAKEVLIVGGGLSGLYMAHRLKQSDASFRVTVLESRRRLGGRLESAQTSAGKSDEVDAFDLGGSWFWPSSQPSVLSLLEELGLESFAQYEEGDLLIERSQTRQAQRLDPRGAGMGDARRLRGGMRSLIEALADRVGRDNIVLGCRMTDLRLVDGDGAGTRVQATCSNGQRLEADRVVLALPPRLAASNGIEFGPPLPKELTSSWAATATWMAPHAKYVAVYDRPFWREQKLSGNAHSTAGPLGEIHDATNYDGSIGALFGFFSIPSSARQAQSEDELKSACRSQLARLFGEQAASPRDEWIRDWSAEEDTATEADQNVAMQAKRVGALKITPDEDESQWHGLVWLQASLGAATVHHHPIRPASIASHRIARSSKVSLAPAPPVTIPTPRHLKRLSLCSPTLPSFPPLREGPTHDLFSPAATSDHDRTQSSPDNSSRSAVSESPPSFERRPSHGPDGLASASSHDIKLQRAKKAVHHMRTYSSQSTASFASHASASRQPSAEILEEDEPTSSSPTIHRTRGHPATPAAMSASSANNSPQHSRFGSRSDAGSIYNADRNMSSSMLSVVDPADMDEIENSVRQSKTIEDFTNIITEFRMNRHTLYSDSLAGQHPPDTGTMPMSASSHSIDQRSEVGDTPRCTCCCSKDDCPRALRARQEWRDLEADLRLSAEIGQALLRRHDAMQSKLQKQAEEYMQQRDGLMTRLTKSYKETSALERELAQSNLNLEAGDSSNRALLHELDEARKQLIKLKTNHARLSGAEEKATSLQRELDDLKQELAAERRRSQAAEARSKKLELKSSQLKDALASARKSAAIEPPSDGRALMDQAAIQLAKDRLAHASQHQRIFSLDINTATVNDDADHSQAIQTLVRDNEALRGDNEKLKALVDASNEELEVLRSSVTNAMSLVASPIPDAANFEENASSYLDTHASAASNPTDQLSPSAHATAIAPRAPPLRNPSHASSAGSFTFPPMSPTTAERAEASLSRSASLALTADSSAASQAAESIAFVPSSRSSETSRDTEKQTADFLSSDPNRRENRTAQLSNLLEYINRLFTRLSTADVDTLTRRLQRQNLAGDAGHLARTTVHSILRDVDGLRDHFRKLIEAEARNHARDDNSSHSRDFANESLVARKEFFALLKAFRDILCELAKLRLCVNDIHLNPGQAAKLLNEHLGANTAEDRSLIPIPSAVNWLGKMLLGGPSGAPSTPSSGAVAPAGSSAAPDAASSSGAKAGRPLTGRTISGHLAPRASPAVVSSTLAVEVKGTHASAAETAQTRLSTSPNTPVGGGLRAGPRAQRGRSTTSLTRVQSRNLSGLFAGSLAPSFANLDVARGVPLDSGNILAPTGSMRPRDHAAKSTKPWQRPLSRIVDDDEISIHRGRAIRQQVFEDSGDEGSDDEMNASSNLLERTLRPRGLSDSSIRSTFVDMADGMGAGPISPVANRIRPSPISRIITPATLSLHSTPSAAPATVSSSRTEDDASASPSVSSERSGSLTPGGAGLASGGASSILSRSEKVLSFFSGGVVGSGVPIQPASATVSASGPSLRQTPSIAALNRAAARGAASHDLSVSPRTTSASPAAAAESRTQAGLGLGLPTRPGLGGAGSGRAGF